MVPNKDHTLAHELFTSYFRGWRDGSGIRSMDEKFTSHPTRPDIKEEYEKGYTDGTKARKDASEVAASRLNYIPHILRAMKEAELELEEIYEVGIEESKLSYNFVRED